MTDRLLVPASLATGPIARGTSRLCLAALLWAVLLCLTQPATAQSNVPQLFGSGQIGNAGQGFSVAVSGDGNTAVVGGPLDNRGIGAAWVFTRSGQTWAQQAKLTTADATGAAQLGWSVALSNNGNTAIIGGPSDNGSVGAAWVFTRSGTTWTQQGAKLSGAGATGTGCAPGVVGNAEQGYSVALSGDGNTAIVGGWADNGSLGAAWVFTRSRGMWSQPGTKLCANDASATSSATVNADILQGFSVALSNDGTTAIVGGPGDSDSIGAAWVFRFSGGKWTQQGSKLAGSNADASQQGFSVALSGDGNTALVGGPGEETPEVTDASVNMSNGAVWAWVFTVSSQTWGQQGDMLVAASTITSTPSTSNPGLGFSVALARGGNTALVGGPTDNANTGAAWAFVRGGGVWHQRGHKLVAPGAVGDAGQATSVALSANGSTAIVGGALNQDGTGAAWVFTNTSPVSAVELSPTLSTHDFNGDGNSDILWRDIAGNVGMWLMKSASILQTAVPGDVILNWSVVGQRDFNGDGFADILWRDTAGNVGMWLMNGTQIISSTLLGTVPTNWSVVGTGDFNGDGYGDILWRDTSGNIAIWLMQGTTIQQAAVVGNVPTSWTVVGADMSGDIFWRNTSTGEVGLWMMNGIQVAQAVDFGAVPLTWTIAGIGDFDGNGSTDILWRDTSGNIAVWLLNGTKIMSTSVIGSVPANWSVAAIGDYNGDDKSDILWTDSAGNVGAWLMNGATILSVATYGNAGTAWSVQSLNAD